MLWLVRARNQYTVPLTIQSKDVFFKYLQSGIKTITMKPPNFPTFVAAYKIFGFKFWLVIVWLLFSVISCAVTKLMFAIFQSWKLFCTVHFQSYLPPRCERWSRKWHTIADWCLLFVSQEFLFLRCFLLQQGDYVQFPLLELKIKEQRINLSGRLLQWK